MSHDPGPWRVEPHEDAADNIKAANDLHVADVYWGDYLSGRANARLIAAAPDLLAACRAAYAAMPFGDTPQRREAERMCREAIDAAVGV